MKFPSLKLRMKMSDGPPVPLAAIFLISKKEERYYKSTLITVKIEEFMNKYINPILSSRTTFQVEPIGEFYFESDHLALKEERRGDYRTLLQVLAVLEAQKVLIQ